MRIDGVGLKRHTDELWTFAINLDSFADFENAADRRILVQFTGSTRTCLEVRIVDPKRGSEHEAIMKR